MWSKQLSIDQGLIFEAGTYKDIEGIAVFNSVRSSRYYLEKRWGEGGDTLTAIMMNPSNASHDKSDATIDQLMNVARRQLGYNAISVVNISSLIDGTSSNLKDSQFVYEPINWSFIDGAISNSTLLFLGWGMKGQLGIHKQLNSKSELIKVFEGASSKLYCYDVSKSNDKKFSNKPMYYVPHPRPKFNMKKYAEAPIRPVREHEFLQLFVR